MRWLIKKRAPVGFLKQLSQYSPLIKQLLYNRGLKDQKQIDEFFKPDYQTGLHDPFLLKGMKTAVKRINQAIKEKEKIVIYGDFDADGICAAAILFLTLKKLGAAEPTVYIPDREKESHGLNQSAIKFLNQTGAGLIITVDCGISDLAEVALAKQLGIEVIITDHHQPKEELPAAEAIINPWQKKDQYPFKSLAGAGVAYKLAIALLRSNGAEAVFEKWLLDFVALATVADVMPIIGENRTLVKYGLAVLAQTQRPGLRALMKVAGLKPAILESVKGQPPKTNLDAWTLGFVLGPRLNAASRIDHADIAFKLLISDDSSQAEAIAQELNLKNQQRQKQVEEIVREIEEEVDLTAQKIIFQGSEDWPVGLIGLVAGKLAEKYHRPSLIYSQDQEKIRCSLRSIPGFNIIKALSECADYLEDFGGHQGAAGASLLKEKLALFQESLLKIVGEELTEEELTPILEIDAQVKASDISWTNYEQISQFAPFGPANPEPKLLIKNMVIDDLRLVGNQKQYLKLVVSPLEARQAKRFKAISFCLGRCHYIKKGDLVDLVFSLIVDQWNGQSDLQLKVFDLKLSEFQLSS